MAVVISQGRLTTTANTKSADQVTGQYQFIEQGTVTLAAKSSAYPVNVTCRVAGISLVDDQPIPFVGTAGTVTVLDNTIVNQRVPRGRVELFFRETAGATPTVEWILTYSK